jgi:hypothetical protein
VIAAREPTCIRMAQADALAARRKKTERRSGMESENPPNP